MADSKQESCEVKLVGLENSNDSDWGLYALNENGIKYAISEGEYQRLKKVRRETGRIPTLDFSQVLFAKTENGELYCGNDSCYCTGACRGKPSRINPFEYFGGDNEVRIAEDNGN